MSQPQTSTEWVQLESGQRIRTHSKAACLAHPCSVHCPSDEAKAIGTRYWRSDRHMMERICEHGIGHPDPDEFNFLRKIGYGPEALDSHATHGCDGCCG